jgi:hypothetical protein
MQWFKKLLIKVCKTIKCNKDKRLKLVVDLEKEK